MFKRKKVRVYLRSGAVLKFRTKEWNMTRVSSSGELNEYEFWFAWWQNSQPWSIRLEDVSAVMVSRW